jgi:hypothetical protein
VQPEVAAGEIAGWSDESLLETAEEALGVGADSDLPDAVRFLVGVTRLLRKRLATQVPTQDDPPAIFFLSPSGPPEGDCEVTSVPMLDNGLSQLAGQLWFVGAAVVAGLSSPMTDWADDAVVFERVNATLGLGATPAVLVETRTPTLEVRFYPRGLGEIEDYREVRLSASAITLDDVFEVIASVHERVLVTPRRQAPELKLWQVQKKCWPHRRAEMRVQEYLYVGLSVAFPSCIVRREQDDSTGRLDLEIEESLPGDPELIARHAILELKVLRAAAARALRCRTNKPPTGS